MTRRLIGRSGARSRGARLATAAALTLPLALAGCGGGGGGGGEVKSLRALDYYSAEPDKSTFTNALNTCGRENGITIQHEHVPGEALLPKVLQQSASRTLPDVLMIDNPDLQEIAATGALSALEDYNISAAGYAQGVVAASTYKGKLYGLQPIANTIGIFYNKDILAKAGVAPPRTWAELNTAAKKLTSGEQRGIAFSAAPNLEGTWQFMPFMWSNGGDEKNIATPETAAALKLWTDLVNDGSASKSVVNWSQADVSDQFIARKAAMMVNGPWEFPLLNARPSLHYGVVPIPVPKTGASLSVPLGGETWTVPNTGDKARQQAAAKIVKCLNSDRSQLLLATERRNVPTKTALQERFIVQQPEMKTFSEMIGGARARSGELGPNWPKAATKIYTAIQDALTGGASPPKALQEAQNG